MSTSLLYQAWGISGYHYRSSHYINGRVIFDLDVDWNRVYCSNCRSQNLIKRGGVTRRLRTLPIGRRSVWLRLFVPRVECRQCGCIRQVKLPFSNQKKSYTKRLEQLIVELSRIMSMRDVALYLKVGWDLVKDVLSRWLSKRYGSPKLHKLSLIAIDEIHVGRGNRFLTIVLDLERGAVVFVGEGKAGETLKPFWKRLKKAGAKIQAVATDMGPAYIKAVQDNIPEATIVFDHFHVIKLFNEKLADLRRDLQRDAEQAEYDVLKGTRWLLLKNPENLDECRNEKERLEKALDINKSLATAYYMKEELRTLWNQVDKSSATTLLQSWINRADVSGINMLRRFARTLAQHRSGILAYYDFRISTGPLEGTNNKIGALQRSAYGYRDMEFFKLRILGLHEAKYAFTG
jgi:transposase